MWGKKMQFYVYNNETNKVLDKIVIAEEDVEGFDYLGMGDSASFVAEDQVNLNLEMGESDIDDCELIFYGEEAYIQSIDKPFASWVTNAKGLWESPVGPMPEGVINLEEGYATHYEWDEDTQTWIEERITIS